MLRRIEKAIQRSLAQRRVLLQRAAPEARVLSLIHRLRPVATQYPLILLGPRGDGGYLVPDALDGISACFSPGVADNSGFEKDCIDRGMRVFMADYSVDGASLGPDADPARYVFEKKFIGVVDDDQHVTMESWVAQSGVDESSDLLLEMDIEGAEFTAVLTMPDALLKRFRVLVLEIHDLQWLWDEAFLTFAEATFAKLLNHHVCVHIHPNGSAGTDRRAGVDIPRVAEFTFVRRDAVTVEGYRSDFPHPLDHDNGLGRVVVLPPTWYAA